MTKKNKETVSLMRTYKFSSKEVNQGKLDRVIAVSKEYRKYYNTLMRVEFFKYYQTGEMPKFLEIIGATNLSKRYKQNCGKHVKSDISSKLSNISNKIRSIITNSPLSEDEKVVLYYINASKKWFIKDLQIRGKEVPKYLLKLSRRLFKQVKGRIPKMRNVTMRLDSRVADVQESKTDQFDRWVKFSTLEKRDLVYLPFNLYNYFNDKKGIQKNEVQIEVKQGTVKFNLIKELKREGPINKDLKDLKIVGIDLGLVNLISSSSGNICGKSLYKKILHRDKIIQAYTKKLRKNGIEKSTPKLDRLYRKVRSLIKNEVGRCLNRLLKQENPDIIVMENLLGISQNTKKSGRLSRSMRRLMSNSGLSKVTKRLEEKAVVLGKKIEKQNPAYTSVECPKCHHVNKRNRKSQAHFKCLKCGYKRNADYVGSLNIRARRSIPTISVYTPYRKVPGLLEEFYSSFRSQTKAKL